MTLAQALRETRTQALQHQAEAEEQRQIDRGVAIDHEIEQRAQSIVKEFLNDAEAKLQAAAQEGKSKLQVCKYYRHVSNDHFDRVQELLAPFCAEHGLRTEKRYDVGFSEEQKGVYITWADTSD